jgi:hypothetical protein
MSREFEGQQGPQTVVVDWFVCVELQTKVSECHLVQSGTKIASPLASNVVLFWN